MIQDHYTRESSQEDVSDEGKDVHQADRDTLGHVTPEVRNHARRPERDPYQRSPCAYIMPGRARKIERNGRLQVICGQVDAAEIRLIAPEKIKMGDVLGNRRKRSEIMCTDERIARNEKFRLRFLSRRISVVFIWLSCAKIIK